MGVPAESSLSLSFRVSALPSLLSNVVVPHALASFSSLSALVSSASLRISNDHADSSLTFLLLAQPTLSFFSPLVFASCM